LGDGRLFGRQSRTDPTVLSTFVPDEERLVTDRIIVDEVRGGEAIDMLQAMNCGFRRLA
jgi:Flp pilus assembly CpaF family ATPase